MHDVTLEDLAARLAAVEKELADHKAATPRSKDWRRTIGMFAGNEFVRELDAECAATREAERDAARADFSE